MYDSYIGSIQMFPYTMVPDGWILCYGQLLNVSQEQALFSLIGNKYGGDGRVNFALPNLNFFNSPVRNKVMATPNENMVYAICSNGIYPSHED